MTRSGRRRTSPCGPSTCAAPPWWSGAHGCAHDDGAAELARRCDPERATTRHASPPAQATATAAATAAARARRADCRAAARRRGGVDRLQRPSRERQPAACRWRRQGAANTSRERQRRRRTSHPREPAAGSARSPSRDRRTDLAARAMDASRRQQRRRDFEGRVGSGRPCPAGTAVTGRHVGNA